MEEKIKIVRTPGIDTRQPDFDPEALNEKNVEKNTLLHRKAVVDSMKYITTQAMEQAKKHDYTKLNGYLPGYVKALKLLGTKEFIEGSWWKSHILLERHHLNSYAPDDVNLIDIMEMLIDGVVASQARGTEYRPVEFKDPDLLNKAFANTEKLLLSLIEVVDTKEELK